MEFFGKRPYTESRQPAQTTGFFLSLVGPGTFEFDIIGECHYQDVLEELFGGGTRDTDSKRVEALLIHDDANPHDDQAVSVSIDGKTVGFLDRTLAGNFRARMRLLGSSGVDAICRAMIVARSDGGEGNVSPFSVALDLPPTFYESDDDDLDENKADGP